MSFSAEPKELAISELSTLVLNGEIKSISVVGSQLSVVDQRDQKFVSKRDVSESLETTFSKYGVSSEQLQAVTITNTDDKSVGGYILLFLPFLLPLLLIGLFFYMLTRQMKAGGMQAMTFGQSKAKIIDPDDISQKKTFADVAGAKEAKQELLEIVDFLKNPKKFIDIGATIPKGVLLMGAPGTGKCVTGDTLLLTNKGVMPISDVPKYFTIRPDFTVEGLDVSSIDPKTLKFDSIGASHWYNLGVQDTKIIETDLGAKIEGTPEHPIVVVNENGEFLFKHLSEIQVGESVVMSRGSNMFGNYTKVPSVDVAYLLGVLVGDGCLTIKDRIIVSTNDQEVLEKVQDAARAHLGAEFVKSSSGKYDYQLCSVEAKTMVRSWGISETYARHKTVPEWIKLAPKEYVVAFLRGLFDTDGSAEKSGAVSLSSANRKLIEEVHAMLLNLGIVARIYDRKKKYNNQMQSYITIYSDFVELFSKEIGFTIKRKQKALDHTISKQKNTNINFIPNQVSTISFVWKVAKEANTRNREFYRNSTYKNVSRYITGERRPSFSGMNTFITEATKLQPALATSPHIAYLKRMASGDFFFTKVTNVKVGRNTVYDLTVPVRHNFVANGFINHNTLLARAVAGEAGVPFFHLSGSEFIEMFVGVGASRVRDLFDMAKKASPSIIFVDEIDAIGRMRGTGLGGGNDEREQTLNQILVEMDGFSQTEKVIVMAATNRPDVLDPALVRPGRFDRRVTLDLPDKKDREEILKVQSRKKPFDESVDLHVIAQRTPGFSGADLYSLMNEAAILAARHDKKQISQADIVDSIEKVILGPERKSHLMSAKEKELTAYHEAGHALVGSVLPNSDPVHKVSIISRGNAGGYTLSLPTDDRKLHSRKSFIDEIAMTLGGYATEELIYGDITTGPQGDLQQATLKARDMVVRYGMSERVGPRALEISMNKRRNQDDINKEHSEELAKMVDQEIEKLVRDGLDTARKIVREYRNVLEAITARLIEVENIEREEFENILRQFNIPVKEDVK